jgi:hypothetical protein
MSQLGIYKQMKITVNNTISKRVNRSLTLGLASVFFAMCATSVALANDPAAKVIIKDEGFYRVTKAKMASVFSMTESNIAASAFHVMNMGRLVPAIRDNGDVVFYGHRYDSAFTDRNVYWIQSGQGPALSTQSVAPGSTPYPSSFTAKRRGESQSVFRGDIIREPGMELDDPIFWRLISSGLSSSNYNATVTLDGVAASTGGSLTIRVKGATDITGRYYHRARILLNNTLLGTFEFEGLNTADATFSVPTGLFVNGNNTIRVQSNPPPGTTFDSFYLDFLEANYQRQFTAVSNRLTIPLNVGLSRNFLTQPFEHPVLECHRSLDSQSARWRAIYPGGDELQSEL